MAVSSADLGQRHLVNRVERNYDWKITRGVLMRTRLPGIHILCGRAMLALAAALLALGVACSSATPTPPPTSTPEPTPTLAPNPTSTPVPVVVDTEVLDLASTRAFVILEEILEELRPRENATDQESAAARYL